MPSTSRLLPVVLALTAWASTAVVAHAAPDPTASPSAGPITAGPSPGGPVLCGPPRLTFGAAPASASIAAAGETDCHRFVAAAGDRVRIRVVGTSGTLAPRAEACAAAPAAEVTCVIGADGPQTILVRDADRVRTGGYTISVQRLNAPVGCSPLGFGTLAAAGQLQTSGETDCWRVGGAAGDRMRVRLVATGGTAEPRAEVLRPDGLTDCTSVDGGDLTCALELGGNQTILIHDASPGPRTGNYRIAIQRLNDPVGCGWRSLGKTAGWGSIMTVGETDCWRFTAAYHERVRVRTVRTAGALNQTVEVIGPDGTTRCGAGTGGYVCQLDERGTYTVLVRDWVGTGYGDYAVSLQSLNNPVGCSSLPYGPSTSPGAVGIAESDCWRVGGDGGRSGDVVRVRVVGWTGALDPVAEVLRPDGTTRCGPTRSDEFDCRLDEDGVHTVLVRDQDSKRAGEYRVAIQQLNDPAGCNGSTTGWIAAGATACWSVPGEAGDRIRFRVISTDGDWDPIAEVVAPGAWLSPCARTAVDEFTCEFDVDGIHTLLVEDYFGPRSGAYGIDWQRLNSPSSCATDRGRLDSTGSILQAAEIDCFTLREDSYGDVGPILATRVRATSGTLDPVVEVLRPDGTTRCGPIPADEWEGCNVSYSPGPVTFLVYDAAGTHSGSYEVYASD